MRRAVVSLAAVVLIGLPTPAAGWRSVDRRQLDDATVVEEPCERSGDTSSREDGRRDDAHGAPRHPDLSVERVHRTAPMPATQPYWGTMRPYWNAPEPPGVIHRQPRTPPLRVHEAK